MHRSLKPPNLRLHNFTMPVSGSGGPIKILKYNLNRNHKIGTEPRELDPGMTKILSQEKNITTIFLSSVNVQVWNTEQRRKTWKDAQCCKKLQQHFETDDHCSSPKRLVVNLHRPKPSRSIFILPQPFYGYYLLPCRYLFQAVQRHDRNN